MGRGGTVVVVVLVSATAPYIPQTCRRWRGGGVVDGPGPGDGFRVVVEVITGEGGGGGGG